MGLAQRVAVQNEGCIQARIKAHAGLFVCLSAWEQRLLFAQ
jgi:hypothetical protein